MKRILLGTTALVAVGVIGAPVAQAQIELGVGGFMEQYFGYGSSDIEDRDHFDQKSDSEIIFSGSTTLDNGLQFGVNVQLEGNTSTRPKSPSTNRNDSSIWSLLKPLRSNRAPGSSGAVGTRTSGPRCLRLRSTACRCTGACPR